MTFGAIARESSRLTCVATSGGQTTMDFDWWMRNVPGYTKPHRDPRSYFGAVSVEERQRTVNEISALTLISEDDPPIFMRYRMPPEAPIPDDARLAGGWKIHHVVFGVWLKERMDELGIEAELNHPGVTSKYGSTAQFFIEKLSVAAAKVKQKAKRQRL